MKITLFVLSFIFSSLLFAQENSIDSSLTPAKTSSLQLHIVGGVSLSYKTMISPLSAFRYSADLSMGGRGMRGERGHFSHFDDEDFDPMGRDNSHKLTLSFQYLHSLQTKVPLFIGIGPFASAERIFGHRRERTFEPFDFDGENIGNRHNGTRIGVGIIGIAGLEYSLTDKIGFLAEWHGSFGYYWQKSHSVKNDDNSLFPFEDRKERKPRHWELGMNSIWLGLSYNF